MRMRHAAVVAGLALGLMSGAAEAQSLEYNVILPLLDGDPGTISGTITTDGNGGTLSANDILSFDLFVYGSEISSAGGGEIITFSGESLFAVGNVLNFRFDNTTSQLIFDQHGVRAQFFAGGNGSPPFYYGYNESFNAQTTLPAGTVLTIGLSEGTVMSPVPLPASAPMFGAALMALGAVGYGLKRKKAAAAA